MSAYSDAVLALSPAGYWRLGESSGTSAADASGNGLTGTYENGVVLGAAGAIAGDSDTAATFDGLNDRVITASTSSPSGASGLSVIAWVKLAALPIDTISNRATIMAAGDLKTPATRRFGFQVKTSTQLRADISNGSTANQNDITLSEALVTDTWYMLGMTWTPSTVVKYYVNGQVAGQVTSSILASLNSASLPISMGTEQDASRARLNGVIDEAALFGSVLSDANIADLYELGISGGGSFIDNTTPILRHIMGGF